MGKKWTFDDVPDLTGKTILVTGANTGIGYAAAEAFARRGAHTILACRNEEKATAARQQILEKAKDAQVDFQALDLSSLESVRTAADALNAKYERLDVLVNNAGVMIPPLTKTEEGFELQFGVNFIGHFALTGLLFDRIEGTPGSRVVTISSLAHRTGKIDFDNLRGEKKYSPWREYCQSKLACLMYTLELQRRLDARGSKTLSLGAHPGGTATDLQRHNGVLDKFTAMFAMKRDQGALPTIYCAAEPTVSPAAYIGPNRMFEVMGYPAPANIAKQAKDEAVAAQLWEVAEQATGVKLRAPA